MAAIIIVSLVIGLATAVNSVRVGDSNKAFFRLGDEIGFETKRVLDYGVFNEQEIGPLMRGYLENYTNYIAQEEVLFIYGDSSSLQALFFVNNSGDVGISTGGIPGVVTIQYTTGDEAEVNQSDDDGDGDIDRVSVLIEDITYEFNLRQGTNFFFVIIKDEETGDREIERFVAKGE